MAKKKGKEVKKVDRPPVGSGVNRVMFSCRINENLLSDAKKECAKKYGMGLSSKMEEFLKNEFPALKEKYH